MKIIFTIFRKELLDTLRDRRTLLTMVAIPTLVVPLILVGVARLITSQNDTQFEKTIRVGLYTNDNGASLVKRLELRTDVELVRDIEPKYFKKFVRLDSLDLALIIDENFDRQVEQFGTGKLTVFYSSTNKAIYERLAGSLEDYGEAVLTERLDSLNTNWTTIEPVEIQQVDVYTSRESIGKAIGGFLPYIFVLFSFLGAFYPAIDLFTGEKERGTLETILSVPVKRIEILTGKMMAISLGGLVSGALSILGMFLAVRFFSGVPEFLRNVIMEVLNPGVISLLLLMIIPLTVFFSGILIPAAIYARSFKEAQTIIQPMILVAVLPLVVVATVPSIELNVLTALLPIINVGLASREIVAGTIDYGLLGLTFVSLIAFSALGAALCVRWFGKEENILRV